MLCLHKYSPLFHPRPTVPLYAPCAIKRFILLHYCLFGRSAKAATAPSVYREQGRPHHVRRSAKTFSRGHARPKTCHRKMHAEPSFTILVIREKRFPYLSISPDTEFTHVLQTQYTTVIDGHFVNTIHSPGIVVSPSAYLPVSVSNALKIGPELFPRSRLSFRRILCKKQTLRLYPNKLARLIALSN